MASVTQTISNYTGGISQQPDEKKLPGQVVEAINVLPDVTEGLQKRPGAELVASLSDGTLNSSTNGKWFHYYRDENEQYIGQVIRDPNTTNDGHVRMWSCIDGSEKTVNHAASGLKSVVITNQGAGFDQIPAVTISAPDEEDGTLATATASVTDGKVTSITVTNSGSGYTSPPTITIADIGTTTATALSYTDLTYYLKHTTDANIQTLTLNDYTYITNRTIPTRMGSKIEPERPPEAYIDLRKIAYSKQYALNIYNNTITQDVSTATRISCHLLLSSNNFCNSSGDDEADVDSGTGERKRNKRIANLHQTYRCDDGAEQLEDKVCPNVGTDIFNINSSIELVDTGPSGDFTYNVRVFNPSNNITSGVTYTRSSATITVTHSANHGFQTGDWVDLAFGGTATDGVYQITYSSPTVYTVTDHFLTSGTETSTAVNVNKGDLQDRHDLYFQITNTGQSTPRSSSSYWCRYTTTHDLLFGGRGWQVNDYFYIWMTDGYYRITVEETSTAAVQANLGLIRPRPTPFDTETTITAESVLGAIRTEILEASGSPFNSSEVQIIGNGLYLTDTNSFNVGSPSNELMNVITSETDNIDDLPKQCKNGYVVKVRNSEAQEDDYYLRFEGENNRDGKGAWTECPKPGRKVVFDETTMPLQLVREGDGTFTLKHIVWEEVLVGDDVTAPEPSFISTDTVDRYINKLIFFRNRLGILSDENVNLSQPGEFFNFWPKSSIQYTPTDNIDLSCSSEYPAIIYDGIQINAGLLLFTKNQQFMLTTDSDVLSPQTAKINSLSTYNFNFNTNPISLGTTVGFLDNAGKYSRFWEMANMLREGEPVVVDQTKVVSKLFDKDLDIISNSRENSIIFFSTKGSSTLFCYSYFANSEKRLQQAWVKWTFSGAIQHHAVLDDALYIVVRDDGKDTMQKIPIKMDTSTLSITDDLDTTDTDDDLTYRVHLDNSKIITASQLGYSTSTGRTGFTKPDGFNSTTGQLVVYCHKADSTSSSSQADQDSDLIGSYALASVYGTNIEWDGDWTDHDIIVGYIYEMKVEFPRIYFTQISGDQVRTDTRGSLVVHRIKLNFGESGMYKTLLKRVGKPDYTEIWEPPSSDFYRGNQIGINEEITRTIPTYEKNKNLSIILTSEHPAPATLYSMSWEGDYNAKYYRSV